MTCPGPENVASCDHRVCRYQGICLFENAQERLEGYARKWFETPGVREALRKSATEMREKHKRGLL